MKLYIVNRIWTSMEEAAEHFTEVFLDLDKANKHISEEEQKWLQDKKKNWFQDEPDDAFDDWVSDALQEDIYSEGYMYRHYIYNEGEEKIFELITKEIEDGVFIVKEDYRYMNNQCEIGSEIHLVTSNFELALSKYLEEKCKVENEFGQTEYHSSELTDGGLMKYELVDDSDVVTLTIERHEVK